MTNHSLKLLTKTKAFLNLGFQDCTIAGLNASSKNTWKNSALLITRALLVACSLSLAACKEQILHNLSEVDVNRVLTRLNDVQIEASKEKQADGRWAVAVRSDQTLQAIKFLNEARVVRESKAVLDSKSSLVSSREDQRLRMERVLSAEIENSIDSMNGVLESHVHLNLPPSDPLFGYRLDSASGSASVLVVLAHAADLRREDIVGLVSGASGVPVGAISVLFTAGIKQAAADTPIKPETRVSELGAKKAISGWSLPNPNSSGKYLGLSLAVFLLGCLLLATLKFRRGSTL